MVLQAVSTGGPVTGVIRQNGAGQLAFEPAISNSIPEPFLLWFPPAPLDFVNWVQEFFFLALSIISLIGAAINRIMPATTGIPSVPPSMSSDTFTISVIPIGK